MRSQYLTSIYPSIVSIINAIKQNTPVIHPCVNMLKRDQSMILTVSTSIYIVKSILNITSPIVYNLLEMLDM